MVNPAMGMAVLPLPPSELSSVSLSVTRPPPIRTMRRPPLSVSWSLFWPCRYTPGATRTNGCRTLPHCCMNCNRASCTGSCSDSISARGLSCPAAAWVAPPFRGLGCGVSVPEKPVGVCGTLEGDAGCKVGTMATPEARSVASGGFCTLTAGDSRRCRADCKATELTGATWRLPPLTAPSVTLLRPGTPLLEGLTLSAPAGQGECKTLAELLVCRTLAEPELAIASKESSFPFASFCGGSALAPDEDAAAAATLPGDRGATTSEA